jgi:hypothetical protein
MPEIICVLSELSGKVFRIKKGEEDLKKGDLCIIESELGGELVVVIDTSSEVCSHLKSARDAVKVIRKATEEDEKNTNGLGRKRRRLSTFAWRKSRAEICR